ncbi:MAG: transcription antitermination factor NusB [Rhodospirillaceae bacterium]|nr:transcription antitermination factor NusB [Rhodospirillaceae bacterium]
MSAQTESSPARSDKAAAKAAAKGAARASGRLAAVQALYQLELTEASSDDVLKDFIVGRQGGIAITEDPATAQEQFVDLCAADTGLMVDLVRCFEARRIEIDAMMASSLSADWPADRLEILLKSILRAAIAELLVRADVPPRVTISEFVDIAHAFYPGPEPRLVNAVLDRVARALGRLESKS